MPARLLTVSACATFLAAAVPAQAYPVSEPYRAPVRSTFVTEYQPAPVVRAYPYGRQVEYLPGARRQFDRFDIEALRLMTRMP